MKKYFFLVIWLIWADTLTKLWSERLWDTQIQIIPHTLSFEYAQNIWIAFSIPITGVFLKILTLILILWIFYYYWNYERSKKWKLLHISYALIFAGAIWNAWERIFRGYVTDFISLEYFAIFNLADSYITLWALWLLYYFYKNSSPWV